MKIEVVTVCDQYSDFLAETLPHNRVLFDRMVVVTSPEDKLTRRVCEHWNVECIPTDVIGSRWGEFCKGRAINVGLSRLALDGWVLHLDADILLPPLSRKMLELAEPRPDTVYGVDRHVCSGHDDWRAFMAMPRLQHESKTWLHLDKFSLSPRVVIENQGYGYIPLGYFQFWNPQGSGVKSYPEGHTKANREDVQFSLNWPRPKRALLPEIVAYHIESANATNGSNWSGRTTAQFGATGRTEPPVAPARRSPAPDTDPLGNS